MSAEPTHCQPHSVAEPCAACNAPKTSETEAIARLREAAGSHVPSVSSRPKKSIVRQNDLRALLDAHAALDAAHAEALDALEACMDGTTDYRTAYAMATAVLAKAGRR